MSDERNKDSAPAGGSSNAPQRSYGDNREGGGYRNDRNDDRGGRPMNRGRGGGGRGFFRKKVCRFCTQNLEVNYKHPEGLRRFITERGKILPRRITGTCAKHQRMLAREIKKSRVIALIPYVKK